MGAAEKIVEGLAARTGNWQFVGKHVDQDARMRRVSLEKLFVGVDAPGEVSGRLLFTLVAFERRAVLPLINHHPEFIANVEPGLGVVREPNRVHVPALEKMDVRSEEHTSELQSPYV